MNSSMNSSMNNPRYILPDSHFDDQLDTLKYSNTVVDAWINNSYSGQNAYTTDYHTPPKNNSYKEIYYKYELKMLLNAIGRADITVGCEPDKFQLAIDRARKAADEPLNQIQPEEEIF